MTTVTAGQIWLGRGEGNPHVIRVLDLLNDGTLRVKRIAGAPDHALGRPFVVTREQLAVAFEARA